MTLLGFLKLYIETYMETQSHPTILEEARVMRAASELKERYRMSLAFHRARAEKYDPEAHEPACIDWEEIDKKALVPETHVNQTEPEAGDRPKGGEL